MSDYKGVLHETAVRFPDTDIWMDSCGEEELDYGLARGIVGATSNPIIVGAVVKKELPYWEPRIRQLIAGEPLGHRGRDHLAAPLRGGPGAQQKAAARL